MPKDFGYKLKIMNTELQILAHFSLKYHSD